MLSRLGWGMLLCALVSCAVTSGCDGGGGGPTLSGLSVNPSTLTYLGGTVTVTVVAKGLDETDQVRCRVASGNDQTDPVALPKRPNDVYAGPVPVPGNPTTAERTWSVIVEVVAAAGGVRTTAARSLTVSAAPSAPPEPPPEL